MKQLTLSLLLMLLPFTASAEAVEIDGIWYNLIEKANKAEVTSKPSGYYSGAIVIPGKVTFDGSEYSVTSIGQKAFLWCKGLTSVTIPNSVTSIGNNAFSSCSGLISVTIPNSVKSIGNNTFSGCSGLTSVTIPNSVKSIGEEAFSGCSSLTSVHITDLGAWCTIELHDFLSNPLYYAHHLYLNGEEIKDLIIPNSVSSIGKYTFHGCSGLTSVSIPNSVTSIEGSAFYNCSGLTSVTIPNSVTSIGGYAFKNCSGLTSVTIPNSVTTIGSEAFSGCSGLTFITIPNSVTSIGVSAFQNCSGLTSITISNNVTSIRKETFSGCSGLTSVTIGSSVTSIGDDAFSGCINLISVTIPNNVSSIGERVFRNCSCLTSVTIPNSVLSIASCAFEKCSGLISVTIPNSVTTIGSEAFSGCRSLTTITIGNGLKTINYHAFAQCPELKDVFCMAEELSSTNNNGSGLLYTNTKAFEGSYVEYATLHVPASATNAYKTTEPWSEFGTFVTLSGEESETQKCATPTISIEDRKIKFSCETEGVEFVSNVSTTDTKDYYDAELTLAYKYRVSVYATKAGYDNSDTATREIVITENGMATLVGDVDGDGKVNVADHVKLTEIIMKQ